MRNIIQELAHRMCGKTDAYRTRYAKINEVDFEAAWRVVSDLDRGLGKSPPTDAPEELKRAILSLARRTLELEHEWS